MRDSCFSMESEGILMVWRARSLSEVTLGVDCMMNNMEGRGSGSNYRRPWWLKIFILAAQKVRKERLEMRISRDRLWREDSISREFDELCTDEVPGDILGLRRLFDMEQFPGLVEHEAWTAIWEFFIERPLLMLFALRFYRRERQTPKPLVPCSFVHRDKHKVDTCPWLSSIHVEFYPVMAAELPMHQIDSNPPSSKPRMASNVGGGDQNADRFVLFSNSLAVNSALDSQSPKH
ncbi:hypothetical protein 19 [Diadegma semiclausum ichnovirus]|nr:hypothetical protein 19 [Diadegma semiclausum ichnovirus]